MSTRGSALCSSTGFELLLSLVFVVEFSLEVVFCVQVGALLCRLLLSARTFSSVTQATPATPATQATPATPATHGPVTGMLCLVLAWFGLGCLFVCGALRALPPVLILNYTTRLGLVWFACLFAAWMLCLLLLVRFSLVFFYLFVK
jgi:hypothetical protein